MAAQLSPPASPLKWDYNTETIMSITRDAIDKSRIARDRVAALSGEHSTFENVFLALANSESDFDFTAEPLAFLQNVSLDKAIRDASNDAEKRDQKLLHRGIHATRRLPSSPARTKEHRTVWQETQSRGAEARRQDVA